MLMIVWCALVESRGVTRKKMAKTTGLFRKERGRSGEWVGDCSKPSADALRSIEAWINTTANLPWQFWSSFGFLLRGLSFLLSIFYYFSLVHGESFVIKAKAANTLSSGKKRQIFEKLNLFLYFYLNSIKLNIFRVRIELLFQLRCALNWVRSTKMISHLVKLQKWALFNHMGYTKFVKFS